MALKLRFLDDCDDPITTQEAYAAGLRQEKDLKQQWKALLAAKDPQSREVRRQETAFVFNFRMCLPYVFVSRCPFCGTLVWEQVGVFSLQDASWFNDESSGHVGPEELGQLCPHLFCLDGALNLNGRQPAEAVRYDRKITMAAEAPFVKPRVLNLPTMVAVIHSLPIAERYTAYTITYFCEQHPEQDAFCIPWHGVEYFDDDQSLPGGNYMGRRSDIQDYDLDKWIEQGQLFWLDPEDEEHPVVQGAVEAFPYRNIAGRRHPYTIKNGKVRDLKDPVETKPKIRTEYF